MTFFKFQLEYFCNQAELHATLDHCALGVAHLFGANIALCHNLISYVTFFTRILIMVSNRRSCLALLHATVEI